MTTLYLRLFGQPRLEQDDRLVEIRSRKGLAMLAYLAASEEDASRDSVATLLWPDFSQTRARANLRRTLYTLQKTPVSRWLRSDGEMLALEPEDETLVDVRRFAHLARQTQPDGLVEAAALYQVDFLAGFFLPDSEPFDAWRTIQQQNYRRQALDLLAQLVNQRLASGKYKEAEEYARRQLAIDDLRESAWRQLMTALASSGRRSEALVEFERCRRLLQDELGVEPVAETVVLAEELRSPTADTAPGRNKAAEEMSGSRLAKRAPLLDLSSFPVPYRGLFAFREDDAPYFFGREEFTELLATAVAEKSIVALVGPSGSGKSSVIYAGLLARLRETTAWLTASFRPGQRPLQALSASLAPLLDDSLGETERLEETNRLVSALGQGRVTLYDVVERIRQKHQTERLIVVADQFEELYTLVRDADQRQQFLDILLELVFMQQHRPAPVFTLILTLRADFLGQALAYRPLADSLQEADVKLGPMTTAELRRAVAQPAEQLGISFEAGLVSRILDDVGHEPGNLPLLEFALTELWEQQSAGHLTHAAYEATGRVEGALARYADGVFAALPADEQTRARRILVQLVRPGEGTEDTRRLATRSELGDDWQLVHRLADARLVVTGRDPAGDDTVEIVHEALIQSWTRFREWLTADRDFRLWQERLRVAVRDWQSHDNDDAGLLRGAALSTAENWLAERPDQLSQAEASFVGASVVYRQERDMETARQQAEREHLRRRFTWALGAGLLLALILAAIALLLWQGASRDRDAARVALARQLAAQSWAMVESDLDLSLLLAVEAVNLAGGEETRQVLTDVLGYSPTLAQFIHVPDAGQAELLRAGFGVDGVLALGDRESITLWRLAGGQPAISQVIKSKSDARSPIVFSPDGSLLATITIQDAPPLLEDERQLGTPRAVAIYNLSDGALVQVIPVDLFANNMLFSPDGSLLAITGLSGVQIWDVQSGRQLRQLEGGQAVYVSFSPDGRLLAGSGVDGGLSVWDVSSGESIVNQPAHDAGIFLTAFSPDGRFLVTGAEDGMIRFWRTTNWSPIRQEVPAHSGPFALVFSADGLTVTSAGEDGIVRRWVVAKGQPLGQPSRGHRTGAVFGLAYLPDGDVVLSGMLAETAGGQVPQIIAWRPEQAPVNSLSGHDSSILGAAFGPDEDMISSVSADGEVKHWSAGGRYLGTSGFIDWSREWWGGGMSPDGRRIARGSRQGAVAIYDGGTGDRLFMLDEPSLPVAGIDFSADSHWIAGAGCGQGNLFPQQCDSGRTWVWDAESGELAGQTKFKVADFVHNEVVISADGRLAASGAFKIGGDESRILLWDVASGNLLAEQEARRADGSANLGLALSPEGDLLAGNGPAGFTTWDVNPAGDLSERWTISDTLDATLAAFSPDGAWLATGHSDGMVRLWDVANGDLMMLEETAHNEEVTALQFSDDGSLLVSGSQGGGLVRYSLTQLPGLVQGNDASILEAACLRANRNLSQSEWRRFFGDQPYRPACAEIGATG